MQCQLSVLPRQLPSAQLPTAVKNSFQKLLELQLKSRASRESGIYTSQDAPLKALKPSYNPILAGQGQS
jgi:hypothetical protein